MWVWILIAVAAVVVVVIALAAAASPGEPRRSGKASAATPRRKISASQSGTTVRFSRSCSAAVPRTSRSVVTRRPSETRRRRAPVRPNQSERGLAPDVACWAASGPGLAGIVPLPRDRPGPDRPGPDPDGYTKAPGDLSPTRTKRPRQRRTVPRVLFADRSRAAGAAVDFFDVAAADTAGPDPDAYRGAPSRSDTSGPKVHERTLRITRPTAACG
jgi:hypothetical protein